MVYWIVRSGIENSKLWGQFLPEGSAPQKVSLALTLFFEDEVKVREFFRYREENYPSQRPCYVNKLDFSVCNVVVKAVV